MDTLYVLKVKCRGVLRRISTRSSPPSFDHVERQIRSLFKVPADRAFGITYTDKDGDVITLSTDDDLQDAFIYQELNPLRLDVAVEEGAADDYDTISLDGSVYSLASLPTSFATPTPAVATPSATPTPAVATPSPAPAPSADPAPAVTAPSPAVTASSAPPKDEAAGKTEEQPQSKAEAGPSSQPEPEAAAASSAAERVDEHMRDLTRVVEEQILKVLAASGQFEKMLEVYGPLLKSAPAKIAEVLSAARKGGLDVVFEPIFEHHAPRAAAAASVANAAAAAASVASAAAAATAHAVASASPSGSSVGGAGEAAEEVKTDDVPAAAAAAASAPAVEDKTEVPVEKETPAPAPAAAAASTSAPAATSPSEAEEEEKPVHHGIICDGCDARPLVGRRYRSLVQYDYDLCEQCYMHKGQPADYECIERPRFCPSRRQAAAAAVASSFLRQHHRHGGHPFGQPLFAGPRHSFTGRPRGPFPYPSQSNTCFPPSHSAGGTVGQFEYGRGTGRMLDARFVKDMSVFDGTEMAPGSRFTKIWRLRNSGSAPWPTGTQVSHIGGDLLAEADQVPLSEPLGGVQPDEEVDVAVDMVAPGRPGRYMSHWRLLAPGGPKFGHRFWALIQVVDGEQDEQGIQEVGQDVAAAAAAATAPESQPEAEESKEVVVEVEEEKGSAAAETETGAGQAGGAGVKVREEEDPIIATIRAAMAAAADALATATEASVPAASAPSTQETVETAAAAAAAGEGWTMTPPAQETAAAEAEASAAATAAVPVAASSESPKAESTAVGSFAVLDVGRDAASDPFLYPPAAVATFSQLEGQSLFADVTAAASSAPASAPHMDDFLGDADDYVKVTEVVSPPTVVAAAAAAATAPVNPALVPSPLPPPSSFWDTEGEGEEINPERLGGVGVGSAEEAELERAVERSNMDVCLGQLEAMGFPYRGLNAELLRERHMDVDAVVEQLVQLGEWQDRLAELEEMEFTDKEMNMRLMLKNGGSLKRTVRELLAIDRAERRAGRN